MGSLVYCAIGISNMQVLILLSAAISMAVAAPFVGSTVNFSMAGRNLVGAGPALQPQGSGQARVQQGPAGFGGQLQGFQGGQPGFNGQFQGFQGRQPGFQGQFQGFQGNFRGFQG